jgi:hypothetical protein
LQRTAFRRPYLPDSRQGALAGRMTLVEVTRTHTTPEPSRHYISCSSESSDSHSAVVAASAAVAFRRGRRLGSDALQGVIFPRPGKGTIYPALPHQAANPSSNSFLHSSLRPLCLCVNISASLRIATLTTLHTPLAPAPRTPNTSTESQTREEPRPTVYRESNPSPNQEVPVNHTIPEIKPQRPLAATPFVATPFRASKKPKTPQLANSKRVPVAQGAALRHFSYLLSRVSYDRVVKQSTRPCHISGSSSCRLPSRPMIALHAQCGLPLLRAVITEVSTK